MNEQFDLELALMHLAEDGCPLFPTDESSDGVAGPLHYEATVPPEARGRRQRSRSRAAEFRLGTVLLGVIVALIIWCITIV